LSENGDLTEFFYLTTIGRKSGKPHQIEIWFVEHDGSYYIVSEGRDHTDWVRNVLQNPAVTYSVGSRSAEQLPATARPLDPAHEPELAAAVSALMDAAYEWSDGLIVEIKPTG
jgi:deazaflavin-dependent oxidoreductase (nitroreductase family)